MRTRGWALRSDLRTGYPDFSSTRSLRESVGMVKTTLDMWGNSEPRGACTLEGGSGSTPVKSVSSPLTGVDVLVWYHTPRPPLGWVRGEPECERISGRLADLTIHA